jgi:hypothetical protein
MLSSKNCKNGQSQHETYFDVRGKERIQYDYRDIDGELFSTVKNSLEDCQEAMVQWLKNKYSKLERQG